MNVPQEWIDALDGVEWEVAAGNRPMKKTVPEAEKVWAGLFHTVVVAKLYHMTMVDYPDPRPARDIRERSELSPVWYALRDVALAEAWDQLLDEVMGNGLAAELQGAVAWKGVGEGNLQVLWEDVRAEVLNKMWGM